MKVNVEALENRPGDPGRPSIACLAAAKGRPIDAVLANAGRGLGRAFIDQNFEAVRRGHRHQRHRHGLPPAEGSRARDEGSGAWPHPDHRLDRRLHAPALFQAVYNGTKAFLDSFSFALRAELKGSGVTVTCLMPGATETDFFERADMLDTKVGTAKKDDPADVAKVGFEGHDERRRRRGLGLGTTSCAPPSPASFRPASWPSSTASGWNRGSAYK